MSEPIRIAIDVMSGDAGPRQALPAVNNALRRYPSLQLVLVGDESVVRAHIDADPRLVVVSAREVVTMDDKPTHALRHKPDSSMRRSIDLLAAGEVAAVVSAGNTGALMAMGTLLLRRLPGIERPALCSPLPTRFGHCYLLDLGANLDCSSAQLHQFAAMGSALASVLDDLPQPRVALLNVGVEAGKGTEVVRAAAALCAADKALNFCGFVEGDQLFQGVADVVVCDGFSGNVALKVCEGTAELIADKMRAAFGGGIARRLLGRLVAPTLRSLYAQLDPGQYNGACLLGLNGVVVKSHGRSDSSAFERAIDCAVRSVQRGLPEQIGRHLSGQVASR